MGSSQYIAEALGLDRADIEYVADLFEHEDMSDIPPLVGGAIRMWLDPNNVRLVFEPFRKD